MGFFDLRKKDKFVDLTKKYKKQQENIKNIREESGDKNLVSEETQPVASGIFGMFGGEQNKKEHINSDDGEVLEKRKKLAKRLMDMTDKIEDLSNQIFHLQQRVEILEKKNTN
ncbi:MAG: hypothetical protein ABFQ65_01350 [Nanoarchaeota archaeon]